MRTTSHPDRRKMLVGLGLSPLAVTPLTLSGCETMDPAILGGVLGATGLTQYDAANGIRAALDNGVLSALGIVGVLGGFLNNSQIHIPLPKTLRDVQSVMSKIGAGGLLSELETQLNRGAEIAAPVAKDIFLDTVSGLTISDAIAIVRGENTAATHYLQERTTPRLTSLFSPILGDALGQTGALKILDEVSSSLRNLPFVPSLGADARSDLIDYGVGKGLGGIFHYIAKEEISIRENPAKRTSEILRRVFGNA